MIWPGVFKDDIKKSQFHDELKFQINNVNTAITYESYLISLISSSGTSLAGTDLLKVNNKHSRTECAICTKLRIKNTRMMSLFVIVLVSLLLNLARFFTYSSFFTVDFEQVNASYSCFYSLLFQTIKKLRLSFRYELYIMQKARRSEDNYR